MRAKRRSGGCGVLLYLVKKVMKTSYLVEGEDAIN